MIGGGEPIQRIGSHPATAGGAFPLRSPDRIVRHARHPRRFGGFSLLEVIIATAILAGSAMVLTSLLGLGSKFGNRAEERTLVASQAQSLIDEWLATADTNSFTASGDAFERTGVLPGRPKHGYRLSVQPFESGLDHGPASTPAQVQSGDLRDVFSMATGSDAKPPRGLVLVHVQVFASEQSDRDTTPLFELSQLVRRSQLNRAASLSANSSPASSESSSSE